jgi:hypothetical protein
VLERVGLVINLPPQGCPEVHSGVGFAAHLDVAGINDPPYPPPDEDFFISV